MIKRNKSCEEDTVVTHMKNNLLLGKVKEFIKEENTRAGSWKN